MEKSDAKPRSSKPAGPPKYIEIDDDTVEIYERIAAMDGAMQRMRKTFGSYRSYGAGPGRNATYLR